MHSKLITVLSIITLFLCLAPINSFSEIITFPKELTGESLYEEGLKLLNQEKYKEAVPYFEEATKRKANYAEAYYQLGLCYYGMKDYEKAGIPLINAKILSKNSDLTEKIVSLQNKITEEKKAGKLKVEEQKKDEERRTLEAETHGVSYSSIKIKSYILKLESPADKDKICVHDAIESLLDFIADKAKLCRRPTYSSRKWFSFKGNYEWLSNAKIPCFEFKKRSYYDSIEKEEMPEYLRGIVDEFCDKVNTYLGYRAIFNNRSSPPVVVEGDTLPIRVIGIHKFCPACHKPVQKDWSVCPACGSEISYPSLEKNYPAKMVLEEKYEESRVYEIKYNDIKKLTAEEFFGSLEKITGKKIQVKGETQVPLLGPREVSVGGAFFLRKKTERFKCDNIEDLNKLLEKIKMEIELYWGEYRLKDSFNLFSWEWIKGESQKNTNEYLIVNFNPPVCPNCKKIIERSWKTCPYCGTKLKEKNLKKEKELRKIELERKQ